MRKAIPLLPAQVLAAIRGKLLAIWMPMNPQPVLIDNERWVWNKTGEWVVEPTCPRVGAVWQKGLNPLECGAAGMVRSLPFAAGQACYGKEHCQYTDHTLNADPGWVYRATDPDWGSMEGWRWLSPSRAPKESSRIKLKVNAVDVRQAGTITWDESLATGVRQDGFGYQLPGDGGYTGSPILCFWEFWDARYGRKPELQFDRNPWAIKLDVETEVRG